MKGRKLALAGIVVAGAIAPSFAMRARGGEAQELVIRKSTCPLNEKPGS